jgi:hypothetical protein
MNNAVFSLTVIVCSDRQQQVAPVAGNNDDRPAVRPQQRGFDRQPADAAPLRNEDQRNGGQANRLRKRLTYRDLQHMTDQSPEELLDVMTKKV